MPIYILSMSMTINSIDNRILTVYKCVMGLGIFSRYIGNICLWMTLMYLTCYHFNTNMIYLSSPHFDKSLETTAFSLADLLFSWIGSLWKLKDITVKGINTNDNVSHYYVEIFHLSFRLINFGSRSAQLAYFVHKGGRKTAKFIFT